MSDEVPFYAPNQPTRQAPRPTPGELLFEFIRGNDRFRCELRDHGEYGVEAQFLKNDEFLHSHRFSRRDDPTRSPRELAVQWAEIERDALQADDAM